MMRRCLCRIALLSMLAQPIAYAGEIQVAGASNFCGTLQMLVEEFEAETGHRVVVSSGSSGKHYAQIQHGAPFDIFFAADSEYPRKLEAENAAVAGTRFTYAIGKLVLWSPKHDFVDKEGAVLESTSFRHLAMANPELAPYGAAAREVLQKRGLWDKVKGKIVQGENIAQTFQFVYSENAELGFVALSQLTAPGREISGSYWEVPQDLYTPIEQQAVLLKESDAARSFLEFCRSEPALELIRGYGYTVPECSANQTSPR